MKIIMKDKVVHRRPDEMGFGSGTPITAGDVLTALGSAPAVGDRISVGGRRADASTPVGPEDTVQVSPLARHG